MRLDQREAQYLFADGDQLTFMDNDTYDQFVMNKEALGDSFPFLQDNMSVTIESHEGKPISVTLPEKVTLAIVEADPVVKGQTATSSYKPAVLENGVKTMVPPFIEVGEKIVVNTSDASYVERAK